MAMDPSIITSGKTYRDPRAQAFDDLQRRMGLSAAFKGFRDFGNLGGTPGGFEQQANRQQRGTGHGAAFDILANLGGAPGGYEEQSARQQRRTGYGAAFDLLADIGGTPGGFEQHTARNQHSGGHADPQPMNALSAPPSQQDPRTFLQRQQANQGAGGFDAVSNPFLNYLKGA